MEIQVGKFREMLELAKPAVARKSTIKSLQYILLKEGQAVATDLETMIILEVREADITTLIPYKDVIKMLQFTPGRERLRIDAKDNKISLSWEDGSATFSTEDPETFPPVPEFTPEVEGILDTDTLIPALSSVLPYVASETSRPVLSGVTLILGDPVEVAAGDGFRMADKVLPLSYPKHIVTIIPSGSVNALNHLWKKSPRMPPPSDELLPVIMAKKEATVAHDGKQGLRFQFEKNITAIIKLVSGQPPDWLKLIPKEEPSLQVQLMAADLELAVRRVIELARDDKGRVRIAFGENKATVSVKNSGQEIKSSLDTLNIKGKARNIAIDGDYLLGYLKGKQGVVTVSMTVDGAPISFLAQNEPRVLIMPMLGK